MNKFDSFNHFVQVNELRSQLDYYTNSGSMTASHVSVEDEFLGSATSRTSQMTAENKHKEQLRKIEKERKEAQEVNITWNHLL